MEPKYVETSDRRFPREDGSLGPPQRGPWRKWAVLGKADRLSAILNAMATVLCAVPLYGGPPQYGNPAAYALVAPLVGALFFAALVVQFLERDNRHGIVRGLLASGALILAIGGVVFAGEVSGGRLLLFYWAPALLGILAAIALQKAHRRVEGSQAVPVRFWHRRS